jgi:hypothetical protein
MSAVEVGQPFTVQGEFGGRHIRSFMLAPDKKQLTLFKEVIGMQQQHALCTGCGPPHSMCVCVCICMCVSPVTPCLCVCQFGETLAKARLFQLQGYQSMGVQAHVPQLAKVAHTIDCSRSTRCVGHLTMSGANWAGLGRGPQGHAPPA